MEVLARSGNRAGALQVAKAHALLMVMEYSATPDADVARYEELLRLQSDNPEGRVSGRRSQLQNSPARSAQSDAQGFEPLRQNSERGGRQPSGKPVKPRRRAAAVIAVTISSLIAVAWFVVRPGKQAVDPLLDRSVSKAVVVVFPFRAVTSPAYAYIAEVLAESIGMRSFRYSSAIVIPPGEVAAYLEASGLGTASYADRVEAVLQHFAGQRFVEGQIVQYSDSLEISVSWTEDRRTSMDRLRLPIGAAETEVQTLIHRFLAGIFRRETERRDSLLRILSSNGSPALHAH